MAQQWAIRFFEGDDVDIYIPTLGRIFQETYASLPKELQQQVRFVIPWEDKILTGNNVLRTPPGLSGIAATRQWIIDRSNFGRPGLPVKVCMLDDDLVFATRREDDPTKFRNSTATEILQLFKDIDSYLDNFAHVGVATREGGNRDTNATASNTRLLRILAYRADVLRDNDVRFDRVELMEDFDVTLQLLRKGYPNLKLNWIVHNQRSSNAPGGCSTYRTLETQREAAIKLATLHPEFVTTVVKQTKTAWNGNERTDVRIGWKAAFDSARTVALLDNGAQPDNVEEGTGTSETME